jgi:glycosyltransferase involved in cell wall biosynthesis
MHIDILLIYRFWFSIHGIPVILNFDELNSAIASRSSLKDRINDFFFDRWVAKLTDGMCPISDYLIQCVKNKGRTQPIMKLPILCDFSRFELTETDHTTVNFLYCGAASYRELISFVIEAFDQLKLSDGNVNLQFILGGKRYEIERVEQIIAGSRNANRIKLDVNVPHAEIPARYSKASALLIPLRPTVQDAARFPHKLGEYLASAKPVITTAYGEINNYDFTDEVSTLVAETYDPNQFSKKMQYVVDFPDKARQIGLRAREMAMAHFDHRKIGREVKDFILSFSYAIRQSKIIRKINE